MGGSYELDQLLVMAACKAGQADFLLIADLFGRGRFDTYLTDADPLLEGVFIKTELMDFPQRNNPLLPGDQARTNDPPVGVNDESLFVVSEKCNDEGGGNGDRHQTDEYVQGGQKVPFQKGIQPFLPILRNVSGKQLGDVIQKTNGKAQQNKCRARVIARYSNAKEILCCKLPKSLSFFFGRGFVSLAQEFSPGFDARFYSGG